MKIGANCLSTSVLLHTLRCQIFDKKIMKPQLKMVSRSVLLVFFSLIKTTFSMPMPMYKWKFTTCRWQLWWNVMFAQRVPLMFYSPFIHGTPSLSNEQSISFFVVWFCQPTFEPICFEKWHMFEWKWSRSIFGSDWLRRHECEWMKCWLRHSTYPWSINSLYECYSPDWVHRGKPIANFFIAIASNMYRK